MLSPNQTKENRPNGKHIDRMRQCQCKGVVLCLARDRPGRSPGMAPGQPRERRRVAGFPLSSSVTARLSVSIAPHSPRQSVVCAPTFAPPSLSLPSSSATLTGRQPTCAPPADWNASTAVSDVEPGLPAPVTPMPVCRPWSRTKSPPSALQNSMSEIQPIKIHYRDALDFARYGVYWQHRHRHKKMCFPERNPCPDGRNKP